LTEIVDASTGAVAKQSFDAWGNLRSASDWRNPANYTLFANRGFTGHEHLEAFALINMNGRVYDPVLGRFLSPDPYVQAPDFSQSFNRYGYCLNNPLKFSDPTGDFWWLAVGFALMQADIAGNTAKNDGGNYWSGFGKSIGVSALSMAVTFGIGQAFGPTAGFLNELGRAGAHGVSGGIFSMASGGKFSNGFMSGALSSLSGSAFQAWGGDVFNNPLGEGLACGLVAGGVSNLTGGDFGMGFIQGFNVGALNHGLHPQEKPASGVGNGEIKQWNKSLVDKWSESKGFFGRLSYDLFDGVAVTLQSFFLGSDSRHINGSSVVGNDRVDAFVNTVSWSIPVGEASTFRPISSGIYSAKWNLRIQAHSHPMSPLKGTGASGTLSPFHLNINKTHIIFNPEYWKYFYKF
jgi:RHS repeat-associated protein